MRYALSAACGALLVLLLVAGCDDDLGPAGDVAELILVTHPASAPAGALVPDLVVRALDAEGRAVRGAELTAVALTGGGAAPATTWIADRRGEVALDWTLGAPPVMNTLLVSAGDVDLELAVRAVVETPPVPEPFADVHAFLTARGREGSTEDLAFRGGDALIIGVPGGLATLAPEGTVEPITLSGDAIVSPLGIAYDAQGRLWVCDDGAVRRVSPGGVVETVLTDDGAELLLLPNHIARAPDGAMVFTDSCLGRIYRVDASSGAITATLELDIATQGGPNGVAFGPDGHLWFTTENTVLLCGHFDIDIDVVDPVAGLYRVALAPEAFEPPVAVAEGIALFGDGLAFDVEGNLYASFITEAGFTLDESIIYVLPHGETTLARFFAVREQVMANLAFGVGPFGDSTLYLTLLAIPPFTAPEARGVLRLPVGIPGLPL